MSELVQYNEDDVLGLFGACTAMSGSYNTLAPPISKLLSCCSLLSFARGFGVLPSDTVSCVHLVMAAMLDGNDQILFCQSNCLNCFHQLIDVRIEDTAGGERKEEAVSGGIGGSGQSQEAQVSNIYFSHVWYWLFF